jgi:hypothetical protein
MNSARGAGNVLDSAGKLGVYVLRIRQGKAFPSLSTIGMPTADACFIVCDFKFQDVRFSAKPNAPKAMSDP